MTATLSAAQKETSVLKHSESELKQHLSSAVVDAQRNAQEWSAAKEKFEGLSSIEPPYHLWVHVYVYVPTSVHTYVQYVCLYLCMYVCMYICMCTYRIRGNFRVT